MIHLHPPDRRAQVSFYAGYRAEERPLSFRVGWRRLKVAEVISRQLEATQAGSPRLVFRVRAGDGRTYQLTSSPNTDEWRVRRLHGPQARAEV